MPAALKRPPSTSYPRTATSHLQHHPHHQHPAKKKTPFSPTANSLNRPNSRKITRILQQTKTNNPQSRTPPRLVPTPKPPTNNFCNPTSTYQPRYTNKTNCITSNQLQHILLHTLCYDSTIAIPLHTVQPSPTSSPTSSIDPSNQQNSLPAPNRLKQSNQPRKPISSTGYEFRHWRGGRQQDNKTEEGEAHTSNLGTWKVTNNSNSSTN